MEGTFEELSHTADTAVAVSAPTLPGLLACAARAMAAVQFDLPNRPPDRTREVAVSATGWVELLWEWLSAVLAWSEVDGVAYCLGTPVLEGDTAAGSVSGWEMKDLERSGPAVKAVTLHDLSVREGPEGWIATIVFDV